MNSNFESAASTRLRESFSLWLVAVVVLVIGYSGAAVAVGPPQGVEVPKNADYGLATLKRANCMTCHKWHGDGGPGYGGPAISLRKTLLNREQLIQTIKCGRPGRGMPFFDRQAYKSDICYGMTFEDFAGREEQQPQKGKKTLNDRQINAVTDFIIAELQGKEVTKEYCEMYYGGTTRRCELLDVETP